MHCSGVSICDQKFEPSKFFFVPPSHCPIAIATFGRGESLQKEMSSMQYGLDTSHVDVPHMHDSVLRVELSIEVHLGIVHGTVLASRCEHMGSARQPSVRSQYKFGS